MSDVADIGEDHPLALELASLRATAAKYQHEAHAAAVKLQRHSLETSDALEQAHALQHENTRLREELEALRAYPDITPHPAALQVPELTLALRRLSDKLTLTEETLLSRTTELAHVRSDLTTAQSNGEAAHALTAQAYTQVEQGRARERELERKVHAAQEERRLTDLVVQEYADLVRNLEGRKSKSAPSPSVSIHASASDSSVTLADSLAEGKLGLQKLLGEHDTEVERLSSQISQLVDEHEFLKTKLDVEQKRAEADRESLAKVLLELDKHRTDDATATKMVSRYMKFSQSTIDSLQQAMENLRTRHASTLVTLNSQIEYLQKAISSEHRQAEKLRDTLDELSEDISREAYGRRREISLRLAFLAREEGLAENLRRWLRRSKESLDRAKGHEEAALREVLDHALHDAESLLESLNGQPTVEGDSPASLARVVAAQNAVASLTQELHIETDRKLRLQRHLAEFDFSGRLPADMDNPFTLTAPPPRHASLGRIQQEKSTGESSSAAKPDENIVDASTTALTSPIEAVSQEVLEDDLLSETVLEDLPNVSTPILSPVTTPPPDSTAERTTTHTNIDLAIVPPNIGADSLFKQNDEVPVEDNSEVQDAPAEEHATTAEVADVPSHVIADGPLHAPVPILAPAPLLSSLSSSAPDDLSVQEPTPDSVFSSVDVSVQPSPSDAVVIPPAIVSSTIAESTASPSAVVFPQKLSDPVENGDAITAKADSPSLLFSPSSAPSDNLTAPGQQNLLPRLFQVKHRYQHLQKAFSDCNVTLKDLKKELASFPPSLDMTSVIRAAVERLDDYNEDARIELEIRIADEERILMGYETLLSVPGALDDDMDEGKLQEDIEAFIDGSNSVVSRAMQQFTRKLDDLEHDIASIKRALHELADSADASSAALSTSSKQNQSWGSWTAGILGGSPRPVSPAPTFGSVMTTPRMRQSSFSLMHKPSPPHDSPSRSPGEDSSSPFASLGLRIAMPSHVASTATPSRPFLSPMGGVSRGPRPRVSSTSLFGLGLGSRSSSFTFGTPNASKSPSSGLARSTTEDAEESSDSDIE